MWLYILVLLIIIFGFLIYQNSRYIKFEIDNDQYQIEKYSPGRFESLDTLVYLRKKLKQLITHLNRKLPNDPYVQRLNQRFENTVLREANPDGDSSSTSYTINKGDTMVLCLRSGNNQLVDRNTLTYVAIHELSHIYSSSYHHSPEFWKNMSFLIDEASQIGIYTPVNYSQNPVSYCGLTIASDIPRVELPAQQKARQQQGGSYQQKLISHLLSRSYVKINPKNLK